MKKYFNEFPTKFWVILGIAFIGFAFGMLIGFDVIEIGQMGLRLSP